MIDRVREHIATQGKTDWRTIAEHFDSRTPRQYRDRWCHYLSPDITVGNWSEEENKLLFERVTEFGPHWSATTHFFPGRTDIRIKNHYIRLTGWKSRKACEPALQRSIMLSLGQTDLLASTLPYGGSETKGE
jgi:hypothetical protein